MTETSGGTRSRSIQSVIAAAHQAVQGAGRSRPEVADHLNGNFFDPAALAGLERMRFVTRRHVEGSYSGRHTTKRRGGAGEFVDYREYTPGDDLRRVDWKAMGRMGRAYLKLFQDETDLSCTLLIDCSGSMTQGARSASDGRGGKLQWSQYFATALAHLLVVQRDAVGVGVVRERLTDYLPPAGSAQHGALVRQAIQQLTPSGTTDLAQGLDDLLIRARRRGVLMILSDFLVDSLDPIIASVRKFRARGWEIIAMHLIHPDERDLPEGNAFRFLDWEGEGMVNCQLVEVRQEYKRRFEAMTATIRGSLLSVGCDYHRVMTSQSYIDVLRSFLVTRSA